MNLYQRLEMWAAKTGNPLGHWEPGSKSELGELLEEVGKLEERTAWIKIEPGCRMPVPQTEVLACLNGNSFSAEWDKLFDKWWHNPSERYLEEKPTHWMPLPEPPRSE
ncbi:DUF551 domain-containing protein [bacterium]|nr:DUF551 domain-containing protein [bacterium]